MFDQSILNVFKTVGAFVLYRDMLALMIGPDQTGERLGIMRFGGHIEKGESLFEALEREIKEEASINTALVNSPRTFYKPQWDSGYVEIKEEVSLKTKPLIIKGDTERATAVFLSYAEDEPKPSSEAHGVIFLDEKGIREVCTSRMHLRDFLSAGGKLIQQKEMDYNMEMYAGVHLRFFFDLLENGDDTAAKYLHGKLR